jgi:hypothetical protein
MENPRPTGVFEEERANPGCLRRSIWDSQLPFIVQLMDPETLQRCFQCIRYARINPRNGEHYPSKSRKALRSRRLDRHAYRKNSFFFYEGEPVT